MLAVRNLLVVLALIAPLGGALAHGEQPHDGDGHARPEPAEPTTVPIGYTGPGREPYVHFFQGTWLYGQLAATPLSDQYPVGLRGSGDWLTWEDAARGDIYVYNIPAGSGFHLQADDLAQRNPAVHGNIVVYEQYGGPDGIDVVAHFLDTGETRIVSRGPGNAKAPSVHGNLIAWEDDRDRNLDIYAYDVENGTEFPIYVSPDRESDPLVFEGSVYFRTYRFNLWDILRVQAITGAVEPVTSDARVEGRPFHNDDQVHYLALAQGGWFLHRYEPLLDETERLDLKFGDTSFISAQEDRILVVARDGPYSQIVARNATSGGTIHVTGGLLLTANAVLVGKTAYATAITENGTSLLALDISPFAWTPRPTLQLVSPPNGAQWLQPLAVTGTLIMPGGWTRPATFTYRVDDGPPTPILPEASWRFTLDPSTAEQGRHIVTIRATFREGPPIETSLALVVPLAAQGLDVEEIGRFYHNARVLGTMSEYLLDNPAAWLVLVLACIAVALLAIRLWIMIAPRRERPTIEYVPPEEA